MEIELKPLLTKGRVVSVNDTAVKIDIQGRLGVITVPRRWVYTNDTLAIGQHVEFYFSYMQVVPKGQMTLNQALNA